MADLLPHFELETVRGDRVRYADLWQRRFVVLVALRDPGSPETRRYVDALMAAGDLVAHETTLVIYEPAAQPTQAAGLPPAPSVTIADRWGEVQHVAAAERDGELPPPAELVEWLRFVQIQCPECQGETR